MNVDYINPVLVAVKDIFSTMVGMEVSSGKPSIKMDTISSFEVNGKIELSGALSGTICISIPKELSFRMASCLLEEEKADLDEDCIDAIKEITNMIVGNAKSNFPNDDVIISVPDLLVGMNADIYPTGLPIISIPFITDEGEFKVDIALETNS